MTKYVVWNEPLGSGKYGIKCEALASDIAKYMIEEYQERHKQHSKYPYPNEEEALQDFITIHWATIVENDD